MEKQQKQHCNFPEKKQNNQHQNQNNNKSNLSYSGHDFLGGTRLTVNVAADPLGFLSCFDALSNGSRQSCLQLLSLLGEGS